jgi:ankyrin
MNRQLSLFFNSQFPSINGGFNLDNANFDITTNDNNSYTPLSFAVSRSNTAAISYLIQNHPNDFLYQNYDKALIQAIGTGRFDILEMLLEHIDSPDILISALLNTCINGHTETLQYLLRAHSGAIDLNVRNHDGMTPLMLACYYNHLPLVTYLLSNYSDSLDIAATTPKNETAFFIACSRGHLSIVQYLLEHYMPAAKIRLASHINRKTADGYTAFMIACHNGHLNIARYLLENHSDIVNVNTAFYEKGYYTAVMLACAQGHLSIVKYLLESCAETIPQNDDVTLSQTDFWGYTTFLNTHNQSINLNYQNFQWPNPFKYTRLYYDKISGINDIVAYVLMERLLLKSLNFQQDTLFIVACKNNKLNILEYLLTHYSDTIDLNATDHQRRTGLMHACMKGYLPIVQYLLENYSHSIDLNARDSQGFSAIMLACESGHLPIVEYVLNDYSDHIELGLMDLSKRSIWPNIWRFKDDAVHSFLSYIFSSFLPATALDVARSENHHHIVSFLQHHQNNQNTMFRSNP